jgi:hypothetical protein
VLQIVSRTTLDGAKLGLEKATSMMIAEFQEKMRKVEREKKELVKAWQTMNTQ